MSGPDLNELRRRAGVLGTSPSPSPRPAPTPVANTPRRADNPGNSFLLLTLAFVGQLVTGTCGALIGYLLGAIGAFIVVLVVYAVVRFLWWLCELFGILGNFSDPLANKIAGITIWSAALLIGIIGAWLAASPWTILSKGWTALAVLISLALGAWMGVLILQSIF